MVQRVWSPIHDEANYLFQRDITLAHSREIVYRLQDGSLYARCTFTVASTRAVAPRSWIISLGSDGYLNAPPIHLGQRGSPREDAFV